MPFCNHCGEVLSPGTPVCPACRSDPQGSSTSTIREAASLHARLDELGPTAPVSPSPATSPYPQPAKVGDRTPARGAVVAGPGAPRPDDVRPLAPGARTAVRAPGGGPVPAPTLYDEPLRLSVTPTVPGYDPNEPSEVFGGRQQAPGPGGPTQEEAIEDFLATDVSLTDNQRRVKHLVERAEEHMQRARTYRALKNRTQSRISYQRALHYYEQVLDIESGNSKAKKGRSECLMRIPT